MSKFEPTTPTTPFVGLPNRQDHHNAHYHPHHHKSRSTSPHPHHHHLKTRSMSPFRGGTKLTDSNSTVMDKKKNMLVCHGSAHAIVFRDHLRMAKIIEEKIDIDDVLSGSDDGGEAEEPQLQQQEQYAEGSYASKKKRSKKRRGRWLHADKPFQWIKRSLSKRAERQRSFINNHNNNTTSSSTDSLDQEINHHLAQDLVPELQSVTLEDIQSDGSVSEVGTIDNIQGLYAPMTPLEKLEWNDKTEFPQLLESSPTPTDDWSAAEREVYGMLNQQQACVKTIQKNEWPTFLKRFQEAKTGRGGTQHFDIGPSDDINSPFNSFVTSTSLLPADGKKMRCYGSEISYPIGVVFGLPTFDSPEAEQEAVMATQTWAWPAGYAAKTEFNIDKRGQLINGRQEALVSLAQIRKYNDEYLHTTDHYIAGRIIKGGFKVVPYNECFLRVGGLGRVVNGVDVSTSKPSHADRSLGKGCGLFVALFIRTITMGDLIHLFRTKARIEKILGKNHVQDIPLLYLHHEHGVRVFTKQLQQTFWDLASTRLHPFPDPVWGIHVSYRDTDKKSLRRKLLEQMDWNNTAWKSGQILTHHQLAKIAGGFGVTDATFLSLLLQQPDFKHVQDVMQQVFAATIRANDYHTARQTVILYSLASVVSTNANEEQEKAAAILQKHLNGEPSSTYADFTILQHTDISEIPKLPSPLATKRWRRATNDEGLLVVLGAVQILKTITVSSAERRTEEAYVAVEEWVQHGEESVAFRVASWKDQRTDQKDGNIAMKGDSRFMAFVTDQSVKNRRKFAQQLRQAAPKDNFSSIGFLQGMHQIVSQMHSPCMRLELLQYILALDNRYSVELIRASIELAATCLSATMIVAAMA